MYTINIGNFEANNQVYENRCLSASIGGIGVDSEIIPWEGTENQPWDYKYENEEFILDIIPIEEPIPEPTQIDKIEAQGIYTAMITDTLLEEEADYIALNEFRPVVEKIKLYYQQGIYSLIEVQKLLDTGKITQEEFDYIIS